MQLVPSQRKAPSVSDRHSIPFNLDQTGIPINPSPLIHHQPSASTTPSHPQKPRRPPKTHPESHPTQPDSPPGCPVLDPSNYDAGRSAIVSPDDVAVAHNNTDVESGTSLRRSQPVVHRRGQIPQSANTDSISASVAIVLTDHLRAMKMTVTMI